MATDDPSLSLLPASEPSRIARYRRLQSWYREVQLGARPGQWPGRPAGTLLGSMLSADDVGVQPDLNFLHPAAFEHACERIKDVPGENGALDPVRLTHNMLSSMPLCFNLFAAISSEPGFLALFQRLFDPAATAVDRLVCEWAPPPSQHLQDRTAFDAIVFYERADGPAFVGVETKYTEPFSQREYGPTDSYRRATADCGWFHDPLSAPDRLKAARSNQLWRNVMLAASLEINGTYGRGSVAVVALDRDPGAAKACDALADELNPTGRQRLCSVSLESIVGAARDLDADLAGWADHFDRRYLDTGAVERAEGPDPTGPRLGRPLSAR
ncbi:PGN_0703 family putative restriction endonuclease [Aquihabitans sp. McL0605]|uniref:PGN_0703 family putative restriction endonuclease n=1 Tax=Aquihabitans sp. McL0605 TaxID=3415671 RepID=UPI003CE83A40